MLTTLSNKGGKYPLLADLAFEVFFGLLSLAFGKLTFEIPGLEGGLQSDFREIHLLIGIFYIRNPLFLILLSVITSFHTAIGLPIEINFGVHTISLIGIWVTYFVIKKYIGQYKLRVLFWVLAVIGYFYLLIIPSYIFLGSISGYLSNVNYIDVYRDFYETLMLEVTVASLVTGLYLIQFEIRGSLEKYKLNLEYVVNERTKELSLANKTLTYLNENLDDMVKYRSKKIEDQLSLLVKYAHMNSHEVRAPLARLQGLVFIIGNEPNDIEKEKLLDKIDASAKELDDVVRKMNRILEREIFSPKKRL